MARGSILWLCFISLLKAGLPFGVNVSGPNPGDALVSSICVCRPVSTQEGSLKTALLTLSSALSKQSPLSSPPLLNGLKLRDPDPEAWVVTHGLEGPPGCGVAGGVTNQ